MKKTLMTLSALAIAMGISASYAATGTVTIDKEVITSNATYALTFSINRSALEAAAQGTAFTQPDVFSVCVFTSDRDSNGNRQFKVNVTDGNSGTGTNFKLTPLGRGAAGTDASGMSDINYNLSVNGKPLSVGADLLLTSANGGGIVGDNTLGTDSENPCAAPEAYSVSIPAANLKGASEGRYSMDISVTTSLA